MTQEQLDKIWEDLGGDKLRNALYEGRDKEWDTAIQKWDQKIKELGGQFDSVAEGRYRSINEIITDLTGALKPLGISVLINTPYKDHEEEQPVIFFKKEG